MAKFINYQALREEKGLRLEDAKQIGLKDAKALYKLEHFFNKPSGFVTSAIKKACAFYGVDPAVAKDQYAQAFAARDEWVTKANEEFADWASKEENKDKDGSEFWAAKDPSFLTYLEGIDFKEYVAPVKEEAVPEKATEGDASEDAVDTSSEEFDAMFGGK